MLTSDKSPGRDEYVMRGSAADVAAHVVLSDYLDTLEAWQSAGKPETAEDLSIVHEAAKRLNEAIAAAVKARLE